MRQPKTDPIIHRRIKKIRKAYLCAIVRFDGDDVHAFRMEVKKLRAFLRLAGTPRQHELPERLQHFYRLTGIIRNLQIQQQQVRETCRDRTLPQHYLTLLSGQTTANALIAKNYKAGDPILKNQQRRIRTSFPRTLTKHRIRAFLLEMSGDLKTLFQKTPPLDDETLHNIRKRLKDLLYVRCYIAKEAGSILPSFLLEETKIVALTETLGKLQDLRSGLNLLQPAFLDRVTDQDERKLLEDIRTDWTKDKEEIKKTIEAQLYTLSA